MIYDLTRALLTADQMRRAESTAFESGMDSMALMETAGVAVAEAVQTFCAEKLPILVLAGHGHNGGDGYIAALRLRQLGYEVAVVSANPDKSQLGDGEIARQRWLSAGNPIAAWNEVSLDHYGLIVDALFGIGLDRAVAAPYDEMIRAVNASEKPVVAVDIPSGIDSDSGEVMGVAIRATVTVTFSQHKPGLWLLPGRAYAGRVVCVDIGLPVETVGALAPHLFLNAPQLWRDEWEWPDMFAHKYTRGHVLVAGGGIEMTGATRLAAAAAARVGAGLVSIACTAQTLPIYALAQASVITRLVETPEAMEALAEGPRTHAILIGPGAGRDEAAKRRTLGLLRTKKPIVLDADSLSAFADDRKSLLSALHNQAVMTPHEGEFERLFDEVGNKIERALRTAKHSGAVIVLKGADTVIASPGGVCVVGSEAPAWLSTAGSGDVLAGIITGLLAQGMVPFEAACAGVWIHSQAALMHGYGMIAEDLIGSVPEILKRLRVLFSNR